MANLPDRLMDVLLIAALAISCGLIIAPLWLLGFGIASPAQAAAVLFAGIVFSVAIAGAMAIFD